MEAFWTTQPDVGDRERDPLALGAIHRSASDALLPSITYRSRRADEFLWVLVGLRWACESATSDRQRWDSFERFEKALKLYWVHADRRTDFAGIRAVRHHLEMGRRGLDFQLLSNQRSLGLLGAYLRSMRATGLVESRALVPTLLGRELVRGVHFGWSGEARTLGTLSQSFGRIRFGGPARRSLGRRLFDSTMRPVATQILRCGEKPAWRRIAARLPPSSGRVAVVADELRAIFIKTTAAIERLCAKQKVPRLGPWSLREAGWKDAIFTGGVAAYRPAFEEFLRRGGTRPAAALVALHHAVWKARRLQNPWVYFDGDQLQVRRDVAKVPRSDDDDGADTGWDMRWSICRQLMRETQWRPV